MIAVGSLEHDVSVFVSKGYAAARKSDGWVKSAVLGRAFRLKATPDPFGNPEYVLRVR